MQSEKSTRIKLRFLFILFLSANRDLLFFYFYCFLTLFFLIGEYLFTMLCSFLLYNIINEFQVYIYPLPCEPSSHPKDLSKNDFKSKNSGASWISTHTHTHTHTKKINLDVDLTFKQHKKFKILCRSSCL